MSSTQKLTQSIIDYSADGYPATEFATAICANCEGDQFTVLVNETHGVAARICVKCDDEHGIGDSDDYVDDIDEIFELECSCFEKTFRVVCGVALYDGSEDVRWFYLGCECTTCGLAGVYADWKNEFNGFKALLARV